MGLANGRNRNYDGNAFNGNTNYPLHVPPNASVSQYWSATLYDRATHGFIRNVSHAGRSSQSPDLQKNADGSVDIYFGPQAPEGKSTNWVPTEAKGGFEVLFRFYGPQQTIFDKTWKLPDVEKMK
jgi:hypothetical protein